MIFINLKHRRPTQTDIPGWKPWTQAQWDAWLDKSHKLVGQLAELHGAGNRDERNALIDANRDHWSELKEWLLALSGGKCWFSEVRELYSHYDVEHFRPKKEAKALDGSERDGYWWLAFDYMNFRICGNVGNRKKGGWFPLREGSLCSTAANRCEESESIYLLDPANAVDVTLIAFDEEGKVIPASDDAEWDRQRVMETVKRLKLNEHSMLTEERRKVWQRMSTLIANFRRAKSVSFGINPAANAEMHLMAEEIRAKTRPEAELSAVARYCVLVTGDRQLARLVA